MAWTSGLDCASRTRVRIKEETLMKIVEVRVEESLLRDPIPGRLMQIVGGSAKGMARLVADDANRQPCRTAMIKEVDEARIGGGVVHGRAVNVTLKVDPLLLHAAFAQGVAHQLLAARLLDGFQPAFLDGGTAKYFVVADDGVVKVDPDTHAPIAY